MLARSGLGLRHALPRLPLAPLRLPPQRPSLGSLGHGRQLATTQPPKDLNQSTIQPPKDPHTQPPPDPKQSPIHPPADPHTQPPKDPNEQAATTRKLGRLQRYAPALAALSARTGVSLPALTASFLVLHEVTAVVPVFLVYWVLHALGVGAGLVTWLADVGDSSGTSRAAGTVGGSGDVTMGGSGDGRAGPGEGSEGNDGRGKEGTLGWKKVVHGWYEEGARKVEYVGRKYGWLGYERGSKMGAQPDGHAEEIVTRDAGAVADAVAAYVVVKALLPLRLGISLAATPSFARFWTRLSRAVRR